jgi:hypothetical protein
VNILRFFRLIPDGEGTRYGSTKVDEIERLLIANHGRCTHVEGGGEYLYRWECKGYLIFVHYRYGEKGLPYAYYGIQ